LDLGELQNLCLFEAGLPLRIDHASRLLHAFQFKRTNAEFKEGSVAFESGEGLSSRFAPFPERNSRNQEGFLRVGVSIPFMAGSCNPDEHFSFQDVFKSGFEGSAYQIVKLCAFGETSSYENATVDIGSLSRKKQRRFIVC
jgi:hypothetical protein